MSNLHMDACDHCGEPVTPKTLGFATAETVLCYDCAEKAATPPPERGEALAEYDLGGEG